MYPKGHRSYTVVTNYASEASFRRPDTCQLGMFAKLGWPSRNCEYLGERFESVILTRSLASGSLKRNTKIDIYGGDVSSIAFLVDGKHVVSGGEGGKIRCWRVADGVEVGTPMEAGSAVYSIAVSRDGKWIVSGTESGLVQVWNAESGEKVTEFKSPLTNTSVREVDVSPDSTQIASGSSDGTVFVWSLSTWKQLFGPWRPSTGEDVLAVKFSPDGRLIATTTKRERGWGGPFVNLRVNDSQDGHILAEVTIETSNFSEQPLAWSSNSKQLFALSDDCKIYCLDATTGTTLSQWYVRGNNARCIILGNNGAFIAASVGSSVSFWDTTTRKRIGSVIEHSTAQVHYINCMAISANYDIAIGGGSRITFRTLHGILPSSYVITFASTLNQTVSLTDAVSTGKPRNGGWCHINK